MEKREEEKKLLVSEKGRNKHVWRKNGKGKEVKLEGGGRERGMRRKRRRTD